MRNKKYDEIHIRDLQVFAKHGVYNEENVLGQKFLVSAVLYIDTKMAAKTDDLTYSTNYGEVSCLIENFLKENTYHLIETAAENVADAILRKYPSVEGVSIEMKKPWAPVGIPVEYISVKIERFWHKAYIAMGSNLGDKKAYLDFAVRKLIERKDCHVDKVSDYIITEPYGYTAQDDFLNGCMEIKTLLSPNELLDVIHDIEKEAKREREIHWGPRTLDLDILLYDDIIMETENLTIPHIEMHKREFVLEPLAQIAPYAEHPAFHKTILELKEALDCK